MMMITIMITSWFLIQSHDFEELGPWLLKFKISNMTNTHKETIPCIERLMYLGFINSIAYFSKKYLKYLLVLIYILKHKMLYCHSYF